MLPVSMEILTKAEPCVSVSDFCAHANISSVDDAESALVEGYIAAAEGAVSREIKRPLGLCSVKFYWPGSAFAALEIGYSPLVSVDAVTVDGEAVTDYSVLVGTYPAVRLANAPAADATIAVTATCGWADVPQELRVAVMMLAAGFYEHRTDQHEGALTNVRAFERLIAVYKQEHAY